VTRSSIFIRRISLKRESVSSFEAYPFHVPAVRGLHDLELTAPVTFFVGENGSGNSTLLEANAVASGFNAEGGTQFPVRNPGYPFRVARVPPPDSQSRQAHGRLLPLCGEFL
jgi:predicted ATPase